MREKKDTNCYRLHIFVDVVLRGALGLCNVFQCVSVCCSVFQSVSGCFKVFQQSQCVSAVGHQSVEAMDWAIWCRRELHASVSGESAVWVSRLAASNPGPVQTCRQAEHDRLMARGQTHVDVSSDEEEPTGTSSRTRKSKRKVKDKAKEKKEKRHRANTICSTSAN